MNAEMFYYFIEYRGNLFCLLPGSVLLNFTVFAYFDRVGIILYRSNKSGITLGGIKDCSGNINFTCARQYCPTNVDMFLM